MKEIMSLDDAKSLMKKQNIIIYGTIRDIESDFLSSFTNIDLISDYFNKVYIIILENDSKDNTRQLLKNWYDTTINKNISKFIILKDNLDTFYPLRAHRLAYCRNLILNYICDNNLHLNCNYAIHCDLDNRFWSVDLDSICNSFQYDLNSWNMQSCVSKNRSYYDFWALRCEESWFNINIFSCDANNVDYNTKINEFETLIKNTNGLLPTTSSFNGMAIYHLNSIINCRYNAGYKCDKCNNINRGCWEDNDHIGLHRQMINNNCKLFINNKMCIHSRPENSISYNEFIKSTNIFNVNKNPLIYLLLKDQIDKTDNWLLIGIDDGENANIISNYCNCNKTLYCFDENSAMNKKKLLLNKNITHIVNDFNTSLSEFNDDVNFIYIHLFTYQELKKIFNNLYNKIKPGCIIIFEKLVNYKEYLLHGLKVLYENIYELGLTFEYLMMNGIFCKEIKDSLSLLNSSQIVAVRITENQNYNRTNINICKIDYLSDEYIDFDWIFYSNNYSDLLHIKSKEESFIHWKTYGCKEGRVCKPELNGKMKMNLMSLDLQISKENINKFQNGHSDSNSEINNEDNFDWEMYIELNPDLTENIQNKSDALKHWNLYGKNEGRIRIFDWCSYVKKYNLLSKCIDCKSKAIQHWIQNGKPSVKEFDNNFDDQLFSWKYYVNKYDDLKVLDTEEKARYHWTQYGKLEGRKCHNFNWTNYLLLNDDLIQAGINSESVAVKHYINHGIFENRQINM